MSCTDVSLTDLEDILKTREDKFDNVNKNFDKYKTVVYQLHEFYLENYTDKFFKRNFIKLFQKLGRRRDIKISKVLIVYAYQKMIKNNTIQNSNGFWRYIQKKPSRNMSGVNSFAILLPPYPVNNDFNGCKHNCYYCPNQTKANGADVDVARSYLLKEPAVQRGYRNGWSAINQMNDRMNSLVVQGHEVDKLELIIEGGTYTEYPMNFLREFHRDIFYSANVYFDQDKRDPLSLEKEIEINMTTNVRIIGVCIETRPDAIDDEWIKFFRATGTTRIQLGVQHTNNRILKKINRGHTFEQSCAAVELLRNNCFKVDIHLMPDLPLSNPEEDRKMFDIIFKSSVICPDQVKIYPCEITPYTVIKQWHDTGKFIPYSDNDPRTLLEVVKYGMKICPAWVRLPRVVRDIPLEYIEGGNKYSNLRQMLDDELKNECFDNKEIRSREIGRNPDYDFNKAIYRYRKYPTGNGLEYFISLESWDEKAIFGFIRLRIPPKDHSPIFSCLYNMGLIRELHVYNWIVPVGNIGNTNTTQHRGVGKRLLQIAEWISYFHNLNGTAVITGEGVRNYYHKRGYVSIETFVIKKFNNNKLFDKLIIYFIIVLTGFSLWCWR